MKSTDTWEKNEQNQRLCKRTQYSSKHKFHLSKCLLWDIAKRIWLFWDIALNLLFFNNKLGLMQPQPFIWHEHSGQQWFGPQTSDQSSICPLEKASCPLEQTLPNKMCLCITVYRSENKAPCYYKGTSDHHHFERSILKLEGTFIEHTIQRLHFLNKKPKTQSNWLSYDT